MNKFKTRHDEIIREIVESIRIRKINEQQTFNVDSKITDEYKHPLEGDYSSLRPDIWFRNEDKSYTIIEVTVPYGDSCGFDVPLLETRFQQNEDKYKGLLNDIKTQFHIDTKLYTIVISSLGAWHKKSLTNLCILSKNKKNWIRFSKRIVMSVIRESRKLFFDFVHIDRVPDDSIIEVNSSEGRDDENSNENENGNEDENENYNDIENGNDNVNDNGNVNVNGNEYAFDDSIDGSDSDGMENDYMDDYLVDTRVDDEYNGAHSEADYGAYSSSAHTHSLI